jgi:hypothetical protein
VHRVGVGGHVDVDPVLDRAHARCLRRRTLVEVDAVQFRKQVGSSPSISLSVMKRVLAGSGRSAPRTRAVLQETPTRRRLHRCLPTPQDRPHQSKTRDPAGQPKNSGSSNADATRKPSRLSTPSYVGCARTESEPQVALTAPLACPSAHPSRPSEPARRGGGAAGDHDVRFFYGFQGPTPPIRSTVTRITWPGGGSSIGGNVTSGPR